MYSHRVLHQPFVDGFCGMGHVDTACEVRFGEDIGEGGSVVHVETVEGDVSIGWYRVHSLGEW